MTDVTAAALLGFGWHLYDVATAMIPHLGGPGYETALDAMVAGYRSHRDLPGEHLDMLPILLMARGLSYVGWAHPRRESAGDMTPLLVETVCELARQLLASGAT